MSYKILNIAAAFVLLFVTSCTGQPHSNDFDQNTNTRKNTNFEKSSFGENLHSMFEDSRGDLWFGTNNGVAKFDGNELTYLTEDDGLCGKTVANITEDKSGNIWFGTHGNMCIYNPLNNEFTHFPKSGDVPTLGYGWKRVNTLNDGNLWVSTHRGTYKYDQNVGTKDIKSFEELETPIVDKSESAFCNTPGLISLDLIDSKGNKWFGTDGHGVYKYDGHEYTHLTKKDGLPSNNITSIVEDAQGNIWFACIKSMNNDIKDGGLCMFNPNVKGDEAFTHFKDLDGLHHNNIFTIYNDKSGDIWVGANGVGLYRFSPASESLNNFKLYKEPKGLSHKPTFHITGLMSMLEDTKGKHWFGFAGGLYFLQGNEIVSVEKDLNWHF